MLACSSIILLISAASRAVCAFRLVLVLFAGIFFIQFDSVLSQETNDPGILRIATSQFPVSRDIDSNAVWIKKHMLEAKQQNVDLIHFPECALSGYAGLILNRLIASIGSDSVHKQTPLCPWQTNWIYMFYWEVLIA